MKYLLSILLLNALFSSVAIAGANCSNPAVLAHNWQCAGLRNQNTVINTGGQTPDTSKTNVQLGSGTPAQAQIVQVYPLPPTVITGTSPVTLQSFTVKPHTFTGTGQPVQVKPLPQKVITGTSLATLQTITAKPHTFTGTGKPVQVNPIAAPSFTGTSPAVPQQKIVIAPPKTFTGQTVKPIPTPVITGISPVPLQPVVIAPPKTFTGQTVRPVPTPVLTGTSAPTVPQQKIVIAPPKTFTGQTVRPVATPILIGQSAVPVRPVMNVPPKPTQLTPSPLPYKAPSIVPTTPVVAAPNTTTPNPLPQIYPPIIITHVASHNLHPNILLQQQMLHGSATLKSLEPHINNLPVDVYTDKNVHNTTFGESTSIDSNGFHLTMVGIKEATFVDTTPLPVAVNADDIIFNFNYASAEIHKDQLSQIDKIIAKHSKNGKQIILMGETDGFGSEDYNKHLATLRAHNIIDELKARGANVDDVEIRILVRCCRKGHPTKEILAETTVQRITWVHFQ